MFRSFHHMIVTQFNTYIKVFRSNNGGEYFKTELIEFMNSKCIYIKLHVLIHHNKMGWLREKIDIYYR